MPVAEELEQRSQIADAQLGVAEDFSWFVAVLSGVAAHLKWESWFITVPVAVAAFVLATFKYRRAAAKAEDAYYRVAMLGKYSVKASERET